MWTILKNRLRQGYRTSPFPKGEVSLPPRFRGRPLLNESRCREGCRACADQCPTGAIRLKPLRIDLGACLFCPTCAAACPTGAVRFTQEYRLGATERSALLADSRNLPSEVVVRREIQRLFGRSLKLRQVSAGGCNGCEADLAVLGTVVFDLSRFGIQFVASPRHADGLVITGPVTAQMRQPLYDAYEAVPSPKLVIALGACAISGGPWATSPAQSGGVPADLPVDLLIPGCPPHPFTILDGMLRLLGQRTGKA